MSFYCYKNDPEVIASFEAPSYALKKFLESQFKALPAVGLTTYLLNKVINGRVFPNKVLLPDTQALNCLFDKLSQDYIWVERRGLMVEIKVAWHIDKQLGLSVLLCMKQLDNEQQGWAMLEQVLIRRSKDLSAWWSYGE
jgi:hypothetical protein